MQTTDAVYAVLTPDDVGVRIKGLGAARGPADASPLMNDAVLELLAARLSAKLKGQLT